MSLLVVDSVHGGYTDQNILHGAGLRVEPGEIVTIIGPNGAGKSTLLKAIIGLVKVRQGSIKLRGEDVTGMGPEQLLDRKVAFVPQTSNVFPSLTVSENLEVAYRGSRPEYRAAVEAVLGLFPTLKDRWKAKAGHLSGGERQLLTMGRALISGADLLLLDEPSAALSPRMVKTIFEKIQEVNRQGTSILLVEQNAKQALRISHRGYVLEGGKNALDGAGASLLDDPRVAQLYLGGGTTTEDPETE
ncbi:MAG: ABC transporter ATP-binding protein [Bacillota bacterium]